jgi:glycosyltransferase involved in cell wall biosynthesis
MPARAAMALGRTMIIPSRAESLPYVVLEAAAAEKPLITTNVGGIPEIYDTLASSLVPAGNVQMLAKAIAAAVDHQGDMRELAQKLRMRVASCFSESSMVDDVMAGYEQAIAMREHRHRHA